MRKSIIQFTMFLMIVLCVIASTFSATATSYEVTGGSIAISGSKVAMVGDTVNLTASTTSPTAPEGYALKNVAWTNATVDGVDKTKATVTSNTAGKVSVTATATFGKEDAEDVTRTSEAFEVEFVSSYTPKLSDETVTLNVGKDKTVTVSYAPALPEDVTATVEWSAEDNKIATVSTSGKITAVAQGSTTVTAKITIGDQEEVTKTVTVNVTGGAYIDCNSVSFKVGSSATLKPVMVGVPSNAAKFFSFSETSSIVSVTFTGKATATDFALVPVTISGYYVPYGVENVEANRVALADATVYVSAYEDHEVEVVLKDTVSSTFKFTDEKIFNSAKYDGKTINADKSLKYLLIEENSYKIEFSDANYSDNIGTWTTDTAFGGTDAVLIQNLMRTAITLNGMSGTMILNYTITASNAYDNVIVATGTLKITVLSANPDILYQTTSNNAITFNKSDFRDFFEKSGKHGDLDYVKFDISSTTPKEGYLYTKVPTSATKDLASARMNFYYNYSSTVHTDTYDYDLDTVTYVPNKQASEAYTDILLFTCYSTNGSETHGVISFEVTPKLVYVKDTDVYPGASFDVPVCIEDNPGFSGFVFTHSYDKSVFTLTEIRPGEVLNVSNSGSFTYNLDTCTVAWEDSRDVTGNGTLYTLHFEISKYAMLGSHTIDIALVNNDPCNFVNENMETIPPHFQDSTVSVSGVVLADLNGDRKISALDAVMLSRARVELLDLTPLQEKSADLDEDGVLTSSDSVIMAKLLVGLPLNQQISYSMQMFPSEPPEVWVGTVDGQPGDLITVPVMMRSDSAVAGFTFRLQYDETRLCLQSVAKGDLLVQNGGSFVQNEDLVSWTNSGGICGEGALLKLTFRIPDNAQSGSSEISVALKDNLAKNFVSPDAQAMSVSLAKGSVSITGGSDDLSIRVGEAIGQPGETITLPVTVLNDPGIAGFTLQLDYDADALTFLEAAAGSALSHQSLLEFNTETNRISWSSDRNTDCQSEELLLLTFKINPAAEKETYHVSIHLVGDEPTNLVNEQCQTLNANFIAGQVEVTAYHWELLDQIAATGQQGAVLVTLQVRNFDPNAVSNVTVMVAAYEADGKLIGCQVCPITLQEGAASTEVTFSSAPAQIRCFLMSSGTSIPLCEATQWNP